MKNKSRDYRSSGWADGAVGRSCRLTVAAPSNVVFTRRLKTVAVVDSERRIDIVVDLNVSTTRVVFFFRVKPYSYTAYVCSAGHLP